MAKQAPWLLAFPLVCIASIATAGPLANPLVDEGVRKLEANNPRAALPLFLEAQKKSPRDPRPIYLAGAAHQKLGESADAEKSFRAALALDGKLAEVRGELGALLVEAKRWPEASRELSRATTDKADLGEAWYNLGLAELAQKHCPQAPQAFATFTRLEPGNADGWVNRSVAERLCKQLPAAAASAAQAVKVAPKDASAHLNLGICLDDVGKLEEAAAAFGAATLLAPSDATAWWSLGRAERKRGKPDAAVVALTKAKDLSPTPSRLADLGLALRDAGKLKEAEAAFRAALAKEPGAHSVRYHLAQTLGAAGRCKDMDAELGKIPSLKQKPTCRK